MPKISNDFEPLCLLHLFGASKHFSPDCKHIYPATDQLSVTACVVGLEIFRAYLCVNKHRSVMTTLTTPKLPSRLFILGCTTVIWTRSDRPVRLAWKVTAEGHEEILIIKIPSERSPIEAKASFDFIIHNSSQKLFSQLKGRI